MHTDRISDIEDDIIAEILGDAWRKLLRARDDGKLPNFDTNVPAQLESWLEEIWQTQLDTYQKTDHEYFNVKRFSIAMAFRLMINNTVGIHYFMEQMHDVGKMAAMDKLVGELREKLVREDNMKRELR